MDLFATRGFVERLRAAPDDGVIPVRVIRRSQHDDPAGQSERVTSASSAAEVRPNVVVRFSPRALRLARTAQPDDGGTVVEHRSTAASTSRRGRALDVVA